MAAFTRLRSPSAARRILDTWLVDRTYYGRQVGQKFASDAAAVRHFLATGERDRLSLTRLFDPSWYVLELDQEIGVSGSLIR